MTTSKQGATSSAQLSLSSWHGCNNKMTRG
jgi:hypothetical protein